MRFPHVFLLTLFHVWFYIGFEKIGQYLAILFMSLLVIFVVVQCVIPVVAKLLGKLWTKHNLVISCC